MEEKKSFTKKELSEIRHDLKSPLTSILGFAELLKTKATTEKEKKWIEAILQDSRRLLDMINEKIQ